MHHIDNKKKKELVSGAPQTGVVGKEMRTRGSCRWPWGASNDYGDDGGSPRGKSKAGAVRDAVCRSAFTPA